MRIALHFLGRELLAVDIALPITGPEPVALARPERPEPAPEGRQSGHGTRTPGGLSTLVSSR